MDVPTTLAGVGLLALTDGVKFLFNEASAALKLWREKKASAAGASPTPQTAPADRPIPAVFEGQLQKLEANLEVVEQLQEPLREARKSLADVVDGIESLDTSNEDLVARIDSLRRLVEAVYHQRITFKGEDRPASGPLVHGEVDIQEVRAYASGVRAKSARSGSVTGTARARVVAEGGHLSGVDIDEIG